MIPKVPLHFSKFDKDSKNGSTSKEDHEEWESSEDESEGESDYESETEEKDKLLAQAESDLQDFTSDRIPDTLKKAQSLFHTSDLSALMADADEAEESREEQTIIKPTIANLIHPPPQSASRRKEVLNITPIITAGKDKKIDFGSAVRLRRSHDRHANILTERTYALKSKYRDYELKRTVNTSQRLEEAARLSTEEGTGESEAVSGMCNSSENLFKMQLIDSGIIHSTPERDTARTSTCGCYKR